MTAVLAFLATHGPAMLASLVALAVGLSHVVPPTTWYGVLISWLAGNFGRPLGSKPPPGALPPRGLASLPLLLVLAVLGILLSAAGAHAQVVANAPPPPPPVVQALPLVAASDPVLPVATSAFGGCVHGGVFCFQPSAMFTAMAINLSKKTVEPALEPGVGYGVTLFKGNWYSTGIDVYVNINPAAQQVSMSLMGKFFNGYFRAGWEKGFIGDVSSRLVFGPGIDF